MKIQDLKDKGFVNVSYPANVRAAVQDAVLAWKDVCSLPDEVKSQFAYSNDGAGVGYERKGNGTASPDPKENFDVALMGARWLEENFNQFNNPILDGFIASGISLNALLKPLIVDFARNAEREFGLEGFADEVRQSSDAFFVRFIHYFGDQEIGKETAGAHPDQSGFTLHLFESHLGLQCFTFNGEWRDMPVSDSETVIIPSMQLQLRSEGILKALTHRVVATPETAISGRFSAVCFVQLKNTSKYDKNRCGRLQDMIIEKGPGFNYGMSHSEFSGLFKS